MRKILKFILKIYKSLKYGKKASSESYVKMLRNRGCKVGEGVYFFSPTTTNIDDVRLDWISIGNYTKFSAGVTILAHDYSSSVLLHTHKKILLPGGMETSIGSNCFIGMNATILMGCKIGNNVIIGNGSIVTKDIPDNCIVAGVPAKVIMTLDEFYSKRNCQYIDDAKRNILHFRELNNRWPDIRECSGFSTLFLERTEENYNMYFKDYMVEGNCKEDVKLAFFETKPLFANYEEFKEYCMK